MARLHALAAPVALALSLLGLGTALPVLAKSEGSEAMEAHAPQSAAPGLCAKDPDVTQPVSETTNPLNAIHQRQSANQIRVERRVVIRISPARPTNRNSLFADLPQQSLNARYEEKKMEKCIPVSEIAGVQTGSGNQLLLFLRDRRIVRMNLEKACRARDFYSGFYIERSKDGNLCVDRDKLQSRTGANCEVGRMRQLVAVSK